MMWNGAKRNWNPKDKLEPMKPNKNPRLSLTTYVPPTLMTHVTAEKLHTLAQNSKKLMEVIQQELKELQAWLELHAWLKFYANNMTQQINTMCASLVPTFICKRNMAAASLPHLNLPQNVQRSEGSSGKWNSSVAQLTQYKQTQRRYRALPPLGQNPGPAFLASSVLWLQAMRSFSNAATEALFSQRALH